MLRLFSPEAAAIPIHEIPTHFLDPALRAVHLPTIFILGACMGSFFNVCIYRIPLGVALSYPPSHCYRCGGPVRWFDNIPLVSYWVLRGRCRHCGASFSIRYFLVELLTAAIFLGIYLKIGYSLAIVPALVFVSLLMIATFTDIDHWIIPDRISMGGIAVGLVLAAVWPIGLAEGNPLADNLFPVARRIGPLVNAAAGAAIGFAALWTIGAIGTIIFRKEAMGWGDMKLFAMFGAFCGVEYLAYILTLACLVGTAAGLVGMAWGRMAARRPMDPALAPLAPDPALAERLTQDLPLEPAERELIGARVRQARPRGSRASSSPVRPLTGGGGGSGLSFWARDPSVDLFLAGCLCILSVGRPCGNDGAPEPPRRKALDMKLGSGCARRARDQFVRRP